MMINQPGVKSERIIPLKKSRSCVKAVLTKKQRELTELMKNPNNVDQVKVKVSEFELAVKKFNEYMTGITLSLKKRMSFVTRMSTLAQLMTWLQSTQVKLQEKIDFSISLHPKAYP